MDGMRAAERHYDRQEAPEYYTPDADEEIDLDEYYRELAEERRSDR